MCARGSVCLYQKTDCFLLYSHTRGGEAGPAQERQHPEKSSTFLSFLCSPSHPATGPAPRENVQGETEESCVKRRAGSDSFRAWPLVFIQPASLCFPTPRDAQARGRPTDAIRIVRQTQQVEAQKSGASDHAAAVARQHDYVHSLLLGNQHFPSQTHTTTAAAQGSRAFERKGCISKELQSLNGSPQPSTKTQMTPRANGPDYSDNGPRVPLELYLMGVRIARVQRHARKMGERA